MLTKIKTALALGMANILRVAWFRLSVRFGFNPVKGLRAAVPKGPFFRTATFADEVALIYKYQPTGFGYIPLSEVQNPPDWHVSILTGHRCPNPQRPWYVIPDFATELGDVKGVWELSRFDWVLGFAREYREGNVASLARLEAWLEDWARANPPYCGPNWKCGQEASIRVMHLAMAAVILGQVEKPQSALLQLVEIHLQRIAPTILYAIAQDNNHGTSEAAALFIGGSWLVKHGVSADEGWQRKGRKWLENRARRLIENDGSCSQYSVNYHRVMLDTFSIVEVWRKHLGLSVFSDHYYAKTAAATEWLWAILQPGGDTPNLGANDGARLLPLAATDYRDFRPSVQLASALFCQRKAVSERGEWDVPLRLLGVDVPETLAPARASRQFDDGGYAILRNEQCFALLRYPRFHFRPGQSDALHLDVWLGARNLLRDGGSYSYNTEEPWQSYFPGVRSHNTVQFDGRDQMPRLSRFLFGEWLKTCCYQPITDTHKGKEVLAGYRDYKGASHTRKVVLGNRQLCVEDEISGFSDTAILRWRLEPGKWDLNGQRLLCNGTVIEVVTSMPVIRFEIVIGWESRYYDQKTELPVLEIEVAEPGRLTTEITWNTL
jgi:hypothetical protein